MIEAPRSSRLGGDPFVTDARDPSRRRGEIRVDLKPERLRRFREAAVLLELSEAELMRRVVDLGLAHLMAQRTAVESALWSRNVAPRGRLSPDPNREVRVFESESSVALSSGGSGAIPPSDPHAIEGWEGEVEAQREPSPEGVADGEGFGGGVPCRQNAACGGSLAATPGREIRAPDAAPSWRVTVPERPAPEPAAKTPQSTEFWRQNSLPLPTPTRTHTRGGRGKSRREENLRRRVCVRGRGPGRGRSAAKMPQFTAGWRKATGTRFGRSNPRRSARSLSLRSPPRRSLPPKCRQSAGEPPRTRAGRVPGVVRSVPASSAKGLGLADVAEDPRPASAARRVARCLGSTAGFGSVAGGDDPQPRELLTRRGRWTDPSGALTAVRSNART